MYIYPFTYPVSVWVTTILHFPTLAGNIVQANFCDCVKLLRTWLKRSRRLACLPICSRVTFFILLHAHFRRDRKVLNGRYRIRPSQGQYPDWIRQRRMLNRASNPPRRHNMPPIGVFFLPNLKLWRRKNLANRNPARLPPPTPPAGGESVEGKTKKPFPPKKKFFFFAARF